MMVEFLMMALAADAGAPADGGVKTFAAELYGACPEAPPSMPLDGGWVLLPPARAQRIACLMETCDVSRQGGQRINDEPPGWWSKTVGFIALGVMLGAGLGTLVR